MEKKIILDLINFIELNYYRVIDIAELEKIAFYSYRNLQRIFKHTTGETIGAFQKRLKLEKAYKLLIYTNNSISDISYEVGFESPPALTKAFKQKFNVSPSEARSHKQALFHTNGIVPKSSSQNVKPEIVYIPTAIIYYQSIKSNYDSDEIETLWSNFMSNIFPDAALFYGIIVDEPLITDHIKCRYDACSSHQSLNTNLPSKEIFGGRYAKFIHHGSYLDLELTYNEIYSSWIFNSKLEFDHGPIIEQYIDAATDAESVTYILIPLQT